MIHVYRGIRAELAKTAGRSALWLVWVPLAVVLPLVVTFGIAYIAESFAKIPGQIGVQAATTQNSLYWVIGISVIVLMLAASHAFAAEYRNKTLDILHRAFPRRWPVPVAKWLFHGTIAAATTFVLLVLIGVALPTLFPVVYGGVDVFSSTGVRFLWSVPVYAFLACGIGIGIGALVRNAAGAIVVLALWVFVLEDAVTFLPNGYEVQRYMPFYNAVFGTGQQLAFDPPWGRNGALLYCAAIFTAVFVLGTSRKATR